MKTNLRRFLIVLFLTFGSSATADDLNCLRDLLPVTDKVSFSKDRIKDRKGLEKPFLVNDRFIVFPEVRSGKISGFYVYGRDRGEYYDIVQTPGKRSSARVRLDQLPKGPMYEMVAQPEGLETVAIAYAPELKQPVNRTPSSAALGASVLPVMGALVALQEKREVAPAYVQPDLMQWQSKSRKLVRLGTVSPKTQDEIFEPIKTELEIRRRWIQTANLDNATFKDLNRILQHSCNQL